MENKKSSDMLYLEECFKNIKSKTNIDSSLESIKRIIGRNFDVNLTISIIDNDTDKFFGMSIYPNINQIQLMIDQIINKKSSSDVIVEMWQKNKDWNLEIDSILLYDNGLNANPAEIVAVLMHEMGHIVYSNTVPQRLSKIIRHKMLSASFTLKKLIQWPKAQKLIQLIFVEACSTKNYNYINLDTERIADDFVVKVGYGDNLDEFIGKLIATQGNSLVNRTESQIDKDVTASVNWVFINIGELEFRKTNLRTTLQTEMLKNPSVFVKQIVFDIKKTFFGSGEDTYANAVVEQYLITEYSGIVTEGLLSIFDKNGKVKKINQNDIDILVIESGRIENEDDKIYVLDLIYDKLNVINAALDFIKANDKDKVVVPKETLNTYKTQLEKLRTTILEMNLKPKQYGLFMKQYPKGYEG